MTSLASYGLALLVCCALLHLLRPMAKRVGLVDEPGGRKPHQGSVPLIGGVAMFCGFSLAALTLDMGLTAYRSFFAAAAILVVVGLLDDMHELSSRARFGAQILAAVLMAYWGGVVLGDLGGLASGGASFALSGWEIVFTVFCTVGVINALNMSDGVDGLAGGLSLVAVLGLA
ncbi:MAG: MraY family glycosyltransferase, partial [Gammaproteobacteria bacterium]